MEFLIKRMQLLLILPACTEQKTWDNWSLNHQESWSHNHYDNVDNLFAFKLIFIQSFISVNETGRRKCLEVGIYLNCLDQELLSPVMLFYRLCGWAQHFHNCFLFFRKSGKQHLHCTMCCLFSTIILYPKTEIQKPLSHGKYYFLGYFSFEMKTVNVVALFIFRH